MSKHQKRLSVPKSWPVARKEQQYTVKAGAGPHGEEGVPLLILLRDVLGYVDSKKEARYALSQESVLINGETPSDVGRPVGMFDLVSFTEREEHYRVFPDEGGRLALTEIDAADTDGKLGKVTGKQQISGGQTQLALHDGRTLLTDDEAISVNDSIVIGTEDAEILAHFPYGTEALVTAVRGQHAGEIGTISDISVTTGSGPNDVTITPVESTGFETASGDPLLDSPDEQEEIGFETIEEYVVVIDENFLDPEQQAAQDEADQATEDEVSDDE